MKNAFLGSIITFFLIFSCNKDNTKQHSNNINVPHSLKTKSQEYTIDTNISSVNWTGYKIEKSLNLSHFGTLSFKKGFLKTKNNNIESGVLYIDMNSITNHDIQNSSQNNKLINTLKNKNFFSVTKYPIAEFVLNSVQKIDGNSDFNFSLIGTLKIKDQSKNIRVKTNIRNENDKLFLNTEKFSINRKDFNLNYQGLPNILIQDHFDLQISLVANSKNTCN